MEKPNIKSILLLILVFLIYSCTGIFTKLASMQDAMSLTYFFFLACAVTILGVYAVLWQKMLSVFPLSFAFQFKSAGIVFGILIPWLVFGEMITLNNIIGAGFIMAGLGVLTWNR